MIFSHLSFGLFLCVRCGFFFIQNRNNTLSSPHSANNERNRTTFGGPLWWSIFVPTLLQTIKKSSEKKMPKNVYFQHDDISMIHYHRQSSSIFNLKIKYNTRFSTSRMDSWLNRPRLLCVYMLSLCIEQKRETLTR